jgi:rhodanese-related sulfurtransferase
MPIDAAPSVENLDVHAIKEGLSKGSILLVDVREPNEFEAGHIPGSVLLPLSVFDIAAIPEANGRRIVLSCRSGRRSLTAAAMAFDQGLPIDAHYEGGFLDWVATGQAVETGSE